MKKLQQRAIGVLAAACLLAVASPFAYAGWPYDSCARSGSEGSWIYYTGNGYCGNFHLGYGNNGTDRIRWYTGGCIASRDMYITYRHGFTRRSSCDTSADHWVYVEGGYSGNAPVNQQGSGAVDHTVGAFASYNWDDWLEIGSDGGPGSGTCANMGRFYPEYDAVYAGGSYESYMYAGNVYQWRYIMNNPAQAYGSWGSPIRFAHTGGVTEGPGWYSSGRVNNGPGTGPGGNMDLYFNMRPTTTGDYNEDFQMVYEGVSWMGDKVASNGNMRRWTRLSRKAPGATDGWDNGGKKKGETVRFAVAGADSWGTGSSYSWDWDASTAQGWYAGNACSVGLEDANDRLAISITGADPYCYSSGGLAINASTCRYLTIRMAASGGSDAQLFWSSSAGGWSGDRHVDWNIVPDGQWHVYRVALPASWSGTVYQVRLDPVGTGAANGQTVYVDWLRIHHVSDGLSGRVWLGTVHGTWDLYSASAMSWDTGNLCWYQDYAIAHGYPQTYYACARVVNNNSQESDNHDRRFGGSGGGTGYRSYKVLNTDPTASNTSGNQWNSDNTPSLQWSYSDTDSNPQSNYRVQVDNDSGFGSPQVDSQFVAGSGTSYAPGSALANGQWYYRVGVLDGLSQSARNGTYTGGVTLGQGGGVSGDTSASFDGTDDHVVVPSFSDSFGSGMTVEFWAYPTASQNWARFMDFGIGSANENILVARNGTSTSLQFEVYNGTATGGWAISANAIINNEWHHYVCVLNSDGTVAMYRDGTALTVSGKTVIPNVVTRTINYIGRSNWSADSYYAGRMDEFAIYDRPLTQAEIQAHYSARTSATTYRDHVLAHSPWAYYRLGESSGTTAYNLNGGLGWSTGTAFRVDAAPPTPVSMTIGTVTADSIAVTGAGTDAHSGINASAGYNYSCTGRSDSGGKGTTHTWTGLTANTEYTGLRVTVSDQAVPTPNIAASSPQTQWTLSVPPTSGSVTPDGDPCLPNLAVTWTAVGGFGAGKIQKYKYAWNQNPTYTWTESETDWSSGTMQTTPTAEGTWYLHIKGYNGATPAVGNGTCSYSVRVPTGAFKWIGGNGDWDFVTADLWQDEVPMGVKYCDSRNVLLDDSAAEAAPAVGLNTAVSPASVLNNSTKDYTISGSGKISGSGGLTKQGSSTLTLNTVNDYSGATTVGGGRLLVNGATGSGAVTVQTGATLGGHNGVIGGDLTVQSGGVLDPGAATGTIGALTSGGKNVTLNSGSTTKVEVNRNGGDELSDQVAGIGTFTAGGTLDVDNLGADLLPGDEFTLFSAGTYNPAGEFTISPVNPNNHPDLAWDTKALKERGVLGVHRHPKANEVHYYRAKGTSFKIYLTPTMYAVADADGDTVVLGSYQTPAHNGGIVTTDLTRLFYQQVNNEQDYFDFSVTDGRGGKGNARFYVWVKDYVGKVTITDTAGGGKKVSFYGIPGYCYIIERSPEVDPPAWTTQATVKPNPAGLVEWDDPAPLKEKAFYQSRTLKEGETCPP